MQGQALAAIPLKLSCFKPGRKTATVTKVLQSHALQMSSLQQRGRNSGQWALVMPDQGHPAGWSQADPDGPSSGWGRCRWHKLYPPSDLDLLVQDGGMEGPAANGSLRTCSSKEVRPGLQILLQTSKAAWGTASISCSVILSVPCCLTLRSSCSVVLLTLSGEPSIPSVPWHIKVVCGCLTPRNGFLFNRLFATEKSLRHAWPWGWHPWKQVRDRPGEGKAVGTCKVFLHWNEDTKTS